MTATSAHPGAAQPFGFSRSSRLGWLLRARQDDPAWARPALFALLAATALLYLIGLGRNGWSNDFYAAAVQAGTKSWKAFLFGSMDSSNFITVDKPAGFLWPMELSARIFGLNSWSLLVPQALEGVATVGVLYTTVRRWFGPAAGLIAGGVTALTPVAVLMFRFDNPDAALVLVLTLAAYAITRAVESGHTRWVVLTGVFLGFGFLCKQLAAFTVLPGFALAYLWAGQPKIWKRVWQLLAGGAAVVVTAGWWVALVELIPASDRPYVGGSTDNSFLNLTFGYNGLGRLTGNEGMGGGPGGGGGAGAAGDIGRELERLLPEGGADRGGGGFGGGGFGGATGINRLFTEQFSTQVTWLLPAALLALAALLWLSLRASRTDRIRAAALVWGGWLLVTGLVFSYMSGTIHPYYTIALAPAIGALIGIGAVELWRLRHTWFAAATMAVGLALTVVWAWYLLDRTPDWFPWLRVVIAVAGGLAAVVILAVRAFRLSVSRTRRILAASPVALALVAGLGGPLAYSIDTSATSHTGSIPSAGPSGAGGFGGPGGANGFPGATSSEAADRMRSEAGGGAGGGPGGGFGGNSSTSAALAKLLEAGASGYRWTAATISSTSAASLELGSNGVPVMAIGGFTGSDPAPTLAEFEQYVAKHEIHYFISGGMGGGGFGGMGGASGTSAESGAAGTGAGTEAGATGEAGAPGASGAPGGTGQGGMPAEPGASAPSASPSASASGTPSGSSDATGDLPGGFGGFGGTGDSSKITSWVEAHYQSKTVGGTTVYDLTKPKAATSATANGQ